MHFKWDKSSHHLGSTASLRYKVSDFLRHFYKHPAIYIAIGALVAPICRKYDLGIFQPRFLFIFLATVE